MRAFFRYLKYEMIRNRIAVIQRKRAKLAGKEASIREQKLTLIKREEALQKEWEAR